MKQSWVACVLVASRAALAATHTWGMQQTVGSGPDLDTAKRTQRGLGHIVHGGVAAEAVVKLQWGGPRQGQDRMLTASITGDPGQACPHAPPNHIVRPAVPQLAAAPTSPNQLPRKLGSPASAHWPIATNPIRLQPTCTSQVASSSTGSGSPRTNASWCSATWSCPGQAAISPANTAHTWPRTTAWQ